MAIQDIVIYILLVLAAYLSYSKEKLTLAGAITGAITGLLIYLGAGLLGVTVLGVFFIAGSWATNWHKTEKNINGITHPRTAGQVLANGGVAALLGAIGWLYPTYLPIIQIMMAGSFAAATADTLSSELGMVYGKRFFNIITLKKDQRGLDGVVSIEGTIIGVAGGAIIAAIFWLYNGWSMAVLVIILSGFLGNLIDSLLGALLERKGMIGNNTVNFLNTLTGALVCYILN